MVTIITEDSNHHEESTFVTITTEHGATTIHVPNEDLPLTIHPHDEGAPTDGS